jgi:hypothetical protein
VSGGREQGDCGSRSSTSHARVIAGEAMANILAGVMGRWQTGISIAVDGGYIFTHDGGGVPGIDACYTESIWKHSLGPDWLKGGSVNRGMLGQQSEWSRSTRGGGAWKDVQTSSNPGPRPQAGIGSGQMCSD